MFAYINLSRALARTLIGVGLYSYICLLPGESLVNFKKKLVGQNMNMLINILPHLINVLASSYGPEFFLSFNFRLSSTAVHLTGATRKPTQLKTDLKV